MIRKREREKVGGERGRMAVARIGASVQMLTDLKVIDLQESFPITILQVERLRCGALC